MPKNCLLAYILIKFRENVSDPFLEQPPFQLFNPNRHFCAPSRQFHKFSTHRSGEGDSSYNRYNEKCKELCNFLLYILRCIILYCVILYCVILYLIVLYWIVLHCVVLYLPRPYNELIWWFDEKGQRWPSKFYEYDKEKLVRTYLFVHRYCIVVSFFVVLYCMDKSIIFSICDC